MKMLVKGKKKFFSSEVIELEKQLEESKKYRKANN
jgi:hypothetical protein